MKKRAKVLAVMCSFTLLAGMTMACGSSGGETKEIVTTNGEETANAEGTEEEATDTEVTDVEIEEVEEVETDTADLEEEEETGITIEEQVLLDHDGIVITAKEYVTDSVWGDGIKLLLENNSDKTVMVGCNALIVNDYMISDLFASEVAAGKKANEIMDLSSTELEAAGIEDVGQIEIYFHIYDSETYDDMYNADCVTIQTSAYEKMDTDTTVDDVGSELYNADGIKIVGKTVDENSFWGTAILLYCENTSGKKVGISVEEMSINGFMMDPFFATTVYDGKKSLDEITVFSSDLEENEIEAIEEVELKFHIYDEDSYDTIAESDPITFYAQ